MVIRAPLHYIYTQKNNTSNSFTYAVTLTVNGSCMCVYVYIREECDSGLQSFQSYLVLEVITEPWLYEKLESPSMKVIIMPQPLLEEISALQCSSSHFRRSVWAEGPAVIRADIVNFVFLQKTLKLKIQTQVWKLFIDSKFVFCSISFGYFDRGNNDRF